RSADGWRARGGHAGRNRVGRRGARFRARSTEAGGVGGVYESKLMPPLVFFLTLWAAHPKIRLVFHSMRTATRGCLIRGAVPVLLSAGVLAGQAKPGNGVVDGKVWVDGGAVWDS